MTNRKILALLIITAISCLPLAGKPADADTIIKEAAKLSDQEKFEESNKLLMDLAKQQPDHPDVYWKISQNYYDIGERIDIEKDKDKKLDMYLKAEEWAKKQHPKAAKGLSLLNARMAQWGTPSNGADWIGTKRGKSGGRFLNRSVSWLTEEENDLIRTLSDREKTN